MQRVQKEARGKFKVWWDVHPEQALNLDFNPIVSFFQLEGEFCLLHWQARPRGLRRWGIYDSIQDCYHPLDWHSFNKTVGILSLLQISDDYSPSALPTAVLLLEGHTKIEDGRVSIIKNSLFSLNGNYQ
jgi:hypothetical protein